MTEKRKPGRPAGIGPRYEKVTITLTAEQIAKARAIGYDGTISAGVRVALSRVPEPPATKP